MSRQTVLLLFGGPSPEHDVSLRSAQNVYDALDRGKYEAILCYVDRQSVWWQVDTVTDQGLTQRIETRPGDSAVYIKAQRTKIDIAFPVIHGTYGEDGVIQGLFESLTMPYVGCGVLASALCMDKVRAKQVLEQSGVKTSPYIVVSTQQALPARGAIEQVIGKGPYFVKPSNGGSSIGVSKVDTYEGLSDAVAIAQQYDDSVLIEEAITGRELEVAVYGNVPELTVSDVGEIIPGAEFYDYDDKYSSDSASQTATLIDLPDDVRRTIREQAEKAYAVLGCRGLARVDFLLAENGTVYLNELNTMPGFTSISMFPKLMEVAGTDYSTLITRLIQFGLR